MAESPSRKSRLLLPSEILHRAVLDSGKTLYRVAKDSGVSYPALHRFANRQRLISLEGFDKLCTYLGLVLKLQRKGERESKCQRPARSARGQAGRFP